MHKITTIWSHSVFGISHLVLHFITLQVVLNIAIFQFCNDGTKDTTQGLN